MVVPFESMQTKTIYEISQDQISRGGKGEDGVEKGANNPLNDCSNSSLIFGGYDKSSGENLKSVTY